MGFDDIKHPEEYFTVGDTLPLRVIKVDPKNKRIVLSLSAFLRKLSEEEVKTLLGRFPKKPLELRPVAEAEGAGADELVPDEPLLAELPPEQPAEEADMNTAEE
jgi:transcriptional accessory protein Tex/SPT6